MTVNKKAYMNHFKTLVTVSGTYTCSPTDWTPNPDHSGTHANLTQIQGARYVVTGGGGMGGGGMGGGGMGLECDSVSHAWSFDVPANVTDSFGGSPATWKSGKVAANIGGNASNGGCDENNENCWGFGIGINFDMVLQIG
ncbi:MAG: hypothetical protein HHJ13_04200 [Phycicoccus sp.]|nr:hypothetical protein [Phycicoccus sp.]